MGANLVTGKDHLGGNEEKDHFSSASTTSLILLISSGGISEWGVPAAKDQTPEDPTNRFDCLEMSAQILREGTGPDGNAREMPL